MSVLDLGLGLAVGLAGLVGVAIGHRRQAGLVGSGGLRRRVAASGDAGSVMVEAAFITPIFILIVIGVVEFGLGFKDQLAVTSSVRAGARLASAEPRISTFATDAAKQVATEGSALTMANVQALWIYKANAAGYPTGSSFSTCPAATCDSFTWSAGAGAFVQSGGTWTSTNQDACQGEQDSVGVYLAYTHPTVTQLPMFGSSWALSSHTVMRLEPIPTLQSGGCK